MSSGSSGAARKRFYTSVSAAEASGGGAQILLDGRGLRTPAKVPLVVPTAALARAIAAEWEGQGALIEPATMPLTRLANSAVDGVAPRLDDVRADIAKYAASDLLCYRAEVPAELARAQAVAWDPILAWARTELGAQLTICAGLMPIPQSDAAHGAIGRALQAYDDAFRLAALHVMTTLTGSVLLALAHARGTLTAGQAWAAAHVDEDFQIAKWGEDAEAKARREARWRDFQAASEMQPLLDRRVQ